MKTLTVANLKANFSDVLNSVKNGEDVIIEFGKKHEKLAIIIPYKNYQIAQTNPLLNMMNQSLMIPKEVLPGSVSTIRL